MNSRRRQERRRKRIHKKKQSTRGSVSECFCVHEEAGAFSLGEAGRDVEKESRGDNEPMGKTIEDVCG